MRVTNKQIKNKYYYILSFGYCDIYYLTRYRDRIAYTAGVYGWNLDAYNSNNIAVTTGYRPISQNVKPYKLKHYNIIKEYNDKARELQRSLTDWDEAKEKTNALLDELIALLIEDLMITTN